MTRRLRPARPEDLSGIEALQRIAYEPWRQSGPWSLANSLRSPTQRVWVLDEGRIVGAVIVWTFKRTWRVYDLAIDPALQGQGEGRRLMQHVESEARKGGIGRLVLEAAPGRLPAWYEGLGYIVEREKPDFYGSGKPAVRMMKRLA